jgi:hypothetical protein
MSRRSEGRAGLAHLEGCIEKCRVILEGWLRYSQLVAAYPQQAVQQRGPLEMAFLQTKSDLARQISVLKSHMGGQCHFDQNAMTLVAGTPSLDAIYSQSDVAVKKLMNEWHRVYIGINEALGEMDELLRKARAHQPVQFAGRMCFAPKPIPWRRIAALAALCALAVGGAGTWYVLRHLLGFWAPAHEQAYALDPALTPEQQMTYMVSKMQASFRSGDLDTFMAAFDDDFRLPDGRGKRELRALVGTYITVAGAEAVKISYEDSAVTIEGDAASVDPVTVDTPEGKVRVRIQARRTGNTWKIVYIGEL